MFIGPVTASEREGSMLHTNHSCDPNIGDQSLISVVRMPLFRQPEAVAKVSQSLKVIGSL